MTRKPRAVLSYDPDLIDRWQAAQAAYRLAADAFTKYRSQLRGLSVRELETFFREHTEFRSEGKLLEAAERQAYLEYLQTERDLRSFERKAKRQRAQSSALKALESNEFLAKITYEVREWCLSRGCPHLADDLTRDSLIHIVERLPDYRPGDASPETWVLSKRRGVLLTFLYDYWRSNRFEVSKVRSADALSGEAEEGKALTVGESAEYRALRDGQMFGLCSGRFIFKPGSWVFGSFSAKKFLRTLVRRGRINERDASVWSSRYVLYGEENQRPEKYEAIGRRFGLTAANVRQITRRTGDVIRSELIQMGMRARTERSLDSGKPQPPMSEELRQRRRHYEWERQRDDFWREFRGEYDRPKKEAA